MIIDVYVTNLAGTRPMMRKHVFIFFTNATRIFDDLEAVTDDDGHARFDTDVEPGEAKICVGRETYGPYCIEDGAAFTVQMAGWEEE